MAALTTGSWTIAYKTGDRKSSTSIQNNKRFVDLKLTLTTGESPSTGVPLPNAGSVGMVRYLDGWTFHNDIPLAIFTTARARAIRWVLNTTANTLVPLQLTMNSGTGTTSGGRSMRAVATSLSLTGAKVFYCQARGW